MSIIALDRRTKGCTPQLRRKSLLPVPGAMPLGCAIAALSVLASFGTAAGHPDLGLAAKHVLLITPEGGALQVDQRSPATDFGPIFEGLKSTPHRGYKTWRVMIFIQGGVVNYANAIASGGNPSKIEAIEAEGFYPIFIGWNAAVGSALASHYNVDRGRRLLPGEQLLVWPCTLIADAGSMVAKAPLTLYQQFAVTDKQRMRFAGSYYSNDECIPYQRVGDLQAEPETVNNLYRALRRNWRAAPEKELAVQLGSYCQPPFRDFRQVSSYWGTLPTKVVFSPLIETLGLAAWQRMRARIAGMFDPPYEFDLRTLANGWTHSKDSTSTVSGEFEDAVRADNDFFVEDRHGRRRGQIGTRVGTLKAFIAELNKGSESGNYDPTGTLLVAHSAGAIVACNILERYPWARFGRIIFMAAACNLGDFQKAVLPYLASPAHPDCRFFDLCLHPQHEIDEWREGAGYTEPSSAALEVVTERGSLPEWIDNYFSTPETFMDRMLGKWANVIPAAHLIPNDLRPRIIIKGFGYHGGWPGADQAVFNTALFEAEAKRGGGPQDHGEFSEWPYWEAWFRTISGPDQNEPIGSWPPREFEWQHATSRG